MRQGDRSRASPRRAFLSDRAGATSAVFALMLVPLVAAFGLALEASGWLVIQRNAQSAADAAAMAAAMNGCAPEEPCAANGPPFTLEAQAVASRMGFPVDDANAVTVERIACPAAPAETCYRAAVSHRTPLLLVRAVGYEGDADYLGGRAQTIRAVAVARRGLPGGFCLMSLSGAGQALRVNGGGQVRLKGCDLWSNSALVCNGLNADEGVTNGYAVGASSCGVNQVSGVAPRDDPFANLSASPPIPAKTCTSRPAQTINATTPWPNNQLDLCGDVQLSGLLPITVDQPNSVLIVRDGHLDLNGRTLQTVGAGSLTVIFTTGGGLGVYDHILTSSGKGVGVLDIAAPATGLFRGVAVLQDGRLIGPKHRLDMTYSGVNPALKIQGLIYMPQGALTLRGAIGLHTGGRKCFGVVASSILVDGAGALFEEPTSECAAAGLDLPLAPGSGARQVLVQ